ncbi:MAG TPA: hypothetical protein VLJ38_20905 [Polyangiaceae bacterium]|nr:hypothetical protein [Polyangiaceae bacterium]
MTTYRHAYVRGALMLALLTGCGGLTVDVPTPEPASAAPTDAGTDTLDDAAPDGADASQGYTNQSCPVPSAPLAASCPCSRRACSAVSMSCPRGSGTSKTRRIGADGGTAALDGTRATRGVPFSVTAFAGSLTKPVDVKLSELAAPTPDGYEDWSPIFALEPFSLEFVNGAALEIPWAVPHAGGGTISRELTTFTSASLDGPWQPLADNYVNAGFCQATLLTGGYFFVGYTAPSDACH